MILAQRQIHKPREQNRESRSMLQNIGPTDLENLAICKEMRLDSCLSILTKINSKWIKDVNVKPQTTNLLGDTGKLVKTLKSR